MVKCFKYWQENQSACLRHFRLKLKNLTSNLIKGRLSRQVIAMTKPFPPCHRGRGTSVTISEVTEGSVLCNMIKQESRFRLKPAFFLCSKYFLVMMMIVRAVCVAMRQLFWCSRANIQYLTFKMQWLTGHWVVQIHNHRILGN